MNNLRLVMPFSSNSMKCALYKVKKNKLWIWKAYRRETGELIDWECGGRDKATLSKLMERLSRWQVEPFCTDNWGL